MLFNMPLAIMIAVVLQATSTATSTPVILMLSMLIAV